MIPIVIEKSGKHEKAYDIYSRLLVERIVFINTEIDDYLSASVVAQLLFLEHQNSKKDIHLYINSPGGSVTAGLAIYDTMQFVRPKVDTLCVGMAASMGAWLLAAGTPGKRSALANARIMIHQPMGGVQGQATDINIQAKEILRLRDQMNGILAAHTGRPVEEIARDTERDYYMSGEEAREYGIVDRVMSEREPSSPGGGANGASSGKGGG